jgi:general stress protein 26
VADSGLDRLSELLETGAAIMVATRDEDLRPHVTRGWGGRLDAAAEALELALTVSDDLHVVADLEANGEIAVTVVSPTSYLAMQVTGHVEWIGQVGPDDRERIDTHLARFVDEVTTVGMSPTVARIAGDRFVAVRIALRQFFEQTPGARAGSRM